jgi:Ca-activated chloride channel homolog
MKPYQSLISTSAFISIFFLLFSSFTLASNEPSKTNKPIHVNDAESGSMIFRFDGIPSIMQIALQTKVQMDITGNINRVTVRQTFTNPSNKWAEGVYVFPLPEDSAVDQLRMYVDERVIEGQIHEKEEAKKIYEKAKQEGKSATLVEQQRPNIFTSSVANIAPGGSITIAIEYQQAVLIDNNTYSIRFPMVVGDRYIPGAPIQTPIDSLGVAPNTQEVEDASKITPLSENHIRDLTGEDFETNLPVMIDINLNAGFELASLNSTYHKIQIEQPSQTTRSIYLGDSYQADRDFELTWSAIKTLEPEIALFTQVKDDNVYLMLMATPPKDEVFKKSDRARELIFIIDSSGSMSGSSIRQAKDSLKEALGRLSPTDRFNIIDFDNGFEPLYESAMPASMSNISDAKSFIKRIDADGGTQMLGPIAFALNSRDSSSVNYLRQIIFITDGQAGNEQAILSEVQFGIEDDRFFTIGIGSAPNSYLLTKLADFGRGAFTFIGDQKEVSLKMNRLFEKLESPALIDIEVNFPPEINAELALDVIYDLYAGETITAAYKMNALPSSLEIIGKTIDGEFRKNITLNASKNTKGIDILWARRKIERLTDIHNNAYTRRLLELSKKDIVELALDYHLVSKFTSLVAVDISPIRPETEELVTQAIIKKAKAEGLEDQIKLNEDGKLQNRDELMLALIKALPEDMVADASAQKQFEMALKSANVPALAYNSMKVPDEIAFLIQPTYIAPSQTATSSELLMYLGLILFFIAFMLRRRLLT